MHVGLMKMKSRFRGRAARGSAKWCSPGYLHCSQGTAKPIGIHNGIEGCFSIAFIVDRPGFCHFLFGRLFRKAQHLSQTFALGDWTRTAVGPLFGTVILSGTADELVLFLPLLLPANEPVKNAIHLTFWLDSPTFLGEISQIALVLPVLDSDTLSKLYWQLLAWFCADPGSSSAIPPQAIFCVPLRYDFSVAASSATSRR
jgi:hypothetical protein